MDAVLEKCRGFLDDKGIKLSRKSFNSLLILLAILMLLPVSLYLARQTTNFLPRAEGQWIQLRDTGCIKAVQNGQASSSRKKTADCPLIPLKLINPFLSNGGTNSAAPSTAASAAGNSPSPAGSPAASQNNGSPQNINVKSFNDDIQAALDSIKQTGGSVYLPAKTYIVDKKIRVYSNTTLFGDGVDQTIIQANEALNLADAVVGNDTNAGQSNIAIREMTIKGNNNTDVIRLRNLDRGFVDKVKLENAISGVILGFNDGKGVTNVRVSNCQVSGVTAHGIFMTLGENNVIDNCFVDSGGSTALGIGLEIGVDGKISNNRVINNTVANGNHNYSFTAGNDFQYESGWINSNNIVCYNKSQNNRIQSIWDQHAKDNIYVGNDTSVTNVNSFGFVEKGGTDPVCDIPAEFNIPALPAKPTADNSAIEKIIDWFAPKSAKAAGGFKKVDVFGCGEILSSPAVGATEGDFVFRAPIRQTEGWETHLQNGADINTADLYKTMWNKFGEDWDVSRVIEEFTISCTLIIDYDGDCRAEVKGPGTSKNEMLSQGQNTTIHLEPNTGSGAGCDETVLIRAQFGSAPPASYPRVRPHVWPNDNPNGRACTDSDGGKVYDKLGVVTNNVDATSGDPQTCNNGGNCTDFDKCANGVLTEYYCDQALVKNETFNCPTGCQDSWSCKTNGSPSASVTLNASPSSAASPTTPPIGTPNSTDIMYRLAESREGLNQAQWKTFAFAGESENYAAGNIFEALAPPALAQDSDDQFTDGENTESDDNFINGASGSATTTGGNIGKQSIDTTFQLTNINPGTKQIWVEYLHPNGSKVVDNITFDFIGQAPQIIGLACNLDVSKQNLNITIQGSRFTDTIGTVESVTPAAKPEITAWNDKQIVATLKKPNISLTEGQKFKIKVTRADGSESGTAVCAVDKSLVSLGARIFCREPGKFDAQNVSVNLVYNPEDNTNPDKVNKIEEKVTIDKDGQIANLKTQLQVGKNYAISIKAPGSLRRTSVFTAQEGTTEILNSNGTPFILPIGDIAPVILVDGQINALDRAELMRQWRILGTTAATQPTGDFNRDGRVNSIDWACMNYDFGASDDPLPVSVPQPASGTINTGGSSATITIPGGSSTPRPSAASPTPVPSPSKDTTNSAKIDLGGKLFLDTNRNGSADSDESYIAQGQGTIKLLQVPESHVRGETLTSQELADAKTLVQVTNNLVGANYDVSVFVDKSGSNKFSILATANNGQLAGQVDFDSTTPISNFSEVINIPVTSATQ